MTSAEQTLEHGRERVNGALERWLPDSSAGPESLAGAMRYAVLGNGKRLRPALVYATGEAVGAPTDTLDAPACAVELIHAYSLVHDDLPAMDDDELRRGVPTCHRQFGEATAILAGDALQSLAFELLTDENSAGGIAPHIRTHMCARLAHATGAEGMTGGQAIDLALEGRGTRIGQADLEQMHHLKTGALIRASIVLGGLAGGADSELIARLDHYGRSVGLSFQIVDDILDVTADTETLGKTQGSDARCGKPTYPSLLGLEASRRFAEQQRDTAIDALDRCGATFDTLRELAAFVVDRGW